MFPCTLILLKKSLRGVANSFAYGAYHIYYICNYYLYLIRLMTRLIVIFHACVSYFLDASHSSHE
jgi:hypothetical protein